MRKARFKETEIVRGPKEVEGGRLVKEVCREYGIGCDLLQLEGQIRRYGSLGCPDA